MPTNPTRLASFASSGGKPGRGSYSVTVAGDGTRCAIDNSIESVQGLQGSKRDHEVTEVDCGELRTLWELAARTMDFQPREREGRVYDYGNRRLRLVLDGREHDVRWNRPLDNGAKVTLLIEELVRLSAAHGRKVHPF